GDGVHAHHRGGGAGAVRLAGRGVRGVSEHHPPRPGAHARRPEGRGRALDRPRPRAGRPPHERLPGHRPGRAAGLRAEEGRAGDSGARDPPRPPPRVAHPRADVVPDRPRRRGPAGAGLGGAGRGGRGHQAGARGPRLPPARGRL
ncbi:MAG: HIT family protein, partial [uncultured Rubrobacteraceae bacterium]